MRHLVLGVGFGLLLGSWGCSSGGDGGGSGQGGSFASGGSAGSGASGGSSGSFSFGGSSGSSSGTPCTPGAADACPTGSFCSIVTSTCIGDGSCAGNADCAPDVCTSASKACVPLGGCVVAADCAAGQTCEEGACVVGGGCGQSVFSTTKLQPNVMILLDRSCSMNNDDAGGDTRWNVAKAAISTVTTSFDSEIRFGLATYSSCLDGGCSAGSVVTPIAENNAGAVNGFLADKLDEGSSDGQGSSGNGVRYLCDSGDPETSTGKSLLALVGEASLQEAQRENAVLLVTDGEESGSCQDQGDAVAGATALFGQTTPVKTYVVGLNFNSGVLNQVAQAGGTDMFIPATNQSELTSALADIAAEVVSCDFSLDMAPEDLSQLFVFFNDDPAGIPQDADNGWSYDETTGVLSFNGTACDQLKAGTVADIDVVFGCAQPVPS